MSRGEGRTNLRVGERSEKQGSRDLVPAEGNFEEHPYFRVGDRNAGSGVLHYNNELRTKEGHVLEQSWTVRAAIGRGLPGRFDQDVYVALLQLIDKRGLPADGWLSFSVYELVELMGRGHSGRDYRQVRDSLMRLSATTIESHNAFYHGGKKRYISDSFSLLSEIKLSEYEGPEGGRADRNAVLLSNYFLESYRANYLKNIDSRFYWSLSSPIAKRLYRLIDKKRNGRRVWEAELFSLRKRIPLSNYKYASKIKEKLAPAHAELIAQDFLEEVSYRKGSRGEYAAYRISEGFQARRAAQIESQSGEEIFCIQRLKAEGMAAETAERMVSDYGPTRIMHYIEALPLQKNVRNPAGWLKKAIEQSYELDMPVSDSPPETGEPVAEDPQPELQLLHDVPVDSGTPDPPSPDPEAREEWQVLLSVVSEEMGAPSMRVWFEGVVPTGLSDGHLRLFVPNPTAAEYVESRFSAALGDAWRRRSGPDASIEILTTEPRPTPTNNDT
jgi:hypothetical protein